MAGEHSRVGKMLVFGAGNVAYSVVPALQAVNGDRGVEVYSRSERSAAALGATYGVEWHSGSWMPGGAYTVCVVAVPDDAVRAWSGWREMGVWLSICRGACRRCRWREG